MSTVLLRSEDYRVRLQAAIFLMNDARVELARLGGLYVEAEAERTAAKDAGDADVAFEAKFSMVILSDRIAATTGHIAGWQDYVNEGCPLDPRAQVTPRTYAHLKSS